VGALTTAKLQEALSAAQRHLAAVERLQAFVCELWTPDRCLAIAQAAARVATLPIPSPVPYAAAASTAAGLKPTAAAAGVVPGAGSSAAAPSGEATRSVGAVGSSASFGLLPSLSSSSGSSAAGSGAFDDPSDELAGAASAAADAELSADPLALSATDDASPGLATASTDDAATTDASAAAGVGLTPLQRSVLPLEGAATRARSRLQRRQELLRQAASEFLSEALLPLALAQQRSRVAETLGQMELYRSHVRRGGQITAAVGPSGDVAGSGSASFVGRGFSGSSGGGGGSSSSVSGAAAHNASAVLGGAGGALQLWVQVASNTMHTYGSLLAACRSVHVPPTHALLRRLQAESAVFSERVLMAYHTVHAPTVATPAASTAPAAAAASTRSLPAASSSAATGETDATGGDTASVPTSAKNAVKSSEAADGAAASTAAATPVSGAASASAAPRVSLAVSHSLFLSDALQHLLTGSTLQESLLAGSGPRPAAAAGAGALRVTQDGLSTDASGAAGSAMRAPALGHTAAPSSPLFGALMGVAVARTHQYSAAGVNVVPLPLHNPAVYGAINATALGVGIPGAGDDAAATDNSSGSASSASSGGRSPSGAPGAVTPGAGAGTAAAAAPPAGAAVSARADAAASASLRRGIAQLRGHAWRMLTAQQIVSASIVSRFATAPLMRGSGGGGGVSSSDGSASVFRSPRRLFFPGDAIALQLQQGAAAAQAQAAAGGKYAAAAAASAAAAALAKGASAATVTGSGAVADSYAIVPTAAAAHFAATGGVDGAGAGEDDAAAPTALLPGPRACAQLLQWSRPQLRFRLPAKPVDTYHRLPGHPAGDDFARLGPALCPPFPMSLLADLAEGLLAPEAQAHVAAASAAAAAAAARRARAAAATASVSARSGRSGGAAGDETALSIYGSSSSAAAPALSLSAAAAGVPGGMLAQVLLRHGLYLLSLGPTARRLMLRPEHVVRFLSAMGRIELPALQASPHGIGGVALSPLTAGHPQMADGSQLQQQQPGSLLIAPRAVAAPAGGSEAAGDASDDDNENDDDDAAWRRQQRPGGSRRRRGGGGGPGDVDLDPELQAEVRAQLAADWATTVPAGSQPQLFRAAGRFVRAVLRTPGMLPQSITPATYAGLFETCVSGRRVMRRTLIAVADHLSGEHYLPAHGIPDPTLPTQQQQQAMQPQLPGLDSFGYIGPQQAGSSLAFPALGAPSAVRLGAIGQSTSPLDSSAGAGAGSGFVAADAWSGQPAFTSGAATSGGASSGSRGGATASWVSWAGSEAESDYFSGASSGDEHDGATDPVGRALRLAAAARGAIHSDIGAASEGAGADTDDRRAAAAAGVGGLRPASVTVKGAHGAVLNRADMLSRHADAVRPLLRVYARIRGVTDFTTPQLRSVQRCMGLLGIQHAPLAAAINKELALRGRTGGGDVGSIADGVSSSSAAAGLGAGAHA
jgi:hypothetical protein